MDEKIKRRGRGRPVKKAPRGQKRIQVSMILSGEIKDRIDEVAKRSGRSFSQTGEMLIEHALSVHGLLQTLNRSLKDIVQDAFEAEMLKRGFRKFHVTGTPRGFAWVPPELIRERSEFRPWDEGEHTPGEIEIEEESK
jgi:hypothetical protein